MSVISEDLVRETIMVLNIDSTLITPGVDAVWFRSIVNEGEASTILHAMMREEWEALGSPSEITIRTKPGDVIGNYFATNIGPDGQFIGNQ